MDARKTPDAHTKHVGVWIRVSTEDQAQGDSPAHHEERAREYAKFNRWNVREVYDLAGVSGKTVMDHPETKRMLADIKRGHISGLIFSKLARLARNTKELLEFSDIFRATNADMISLQEKIDTSSPAGRLFYTMIAAMAQWEREEIGERVRASIGVRAKLGKPLNGSSPYGYKWVNKQLTLDPAEAPILKRLFELFIEYKRKGAVARILNEAGYRTRTGAQWTDTTVSRVLVQPCAKGTYFYNMRRKVGTWRSEEKAEDQWSKLLVTPAISEHLWFQSSRILEEQAKNLAPPGKRPMRLFGGLTVCHCGTKMYVPSGSRKYTCVDCKNKILDEDLEAIFYEEIKGHFESPKKIAEQLRTARQSFAEIEHRIATHKGKIVKVREEMARTHRLFQDGKISAESFAEYHRPQEERLRQLQSELPRLEAENTHLAIHDLSVEEIIREARELYARWPDLGLDDKRKIVQSIAEKITIGKDEIQIHLSHMPSSEGMTNSQQRL